jgi:Cytochrome c
LRRLPYAARAVLPGKSLSANGPNGKLYLTGGTVEHWYASNLRSACLQKTLSAQDFALLLQTGSAQNYTVAGGMTEVIHHSTQHLDHEDLLAMGVYLKSLPSETSAQVAGTQPDPAAVQRGKALYDQHCVACHQPNGQGVPAPFPAWWPIPLCSASTRPTPSTSFWPGRAPR